MTDIKKISELESANVDDSMEFVMVDKDNGKSNRVTLDKLKEHIKQKGTKGVQGPVGDSGERGEKGVKGFKGSPEPDGDKGFPGGEGDKGFKGAKGIKGIKGNKGIKGKQASFFELEANRGDKGPKGQVGDVATPTIEDKGFKGTPGVNAEKGEIGVSGAVGDIGASESKGNKGLKGNKGKKGVPGVTAAAIGSLANGGDGQKGPKGPKGFKGNKGPKGVKGLKGPKGVNGITGIRSQWIWTAFQGDGLDSNLLGLQMMEGSCIPRYSNDNFKPIPSSVGTMKSQHGQNRFGKIGGPRNGAWDSGVYSEQRINVATQNVAILTIVPNREDCLWAMGFTSQNPATFSSPPTRTHLDYAFYFAANSQRQGNWRIIQKGNVVKWPGTNADMVGVFSPGDQFQIFWDGVNNKIDYNVPGGSLGNAGQSERFTAFSSDCEYKSGTFGASSCFKFAALDQTRFVTFRA